MTSVAASARRDPQAGLTLVEMLVALAIFALVGLASFATLDTIIRVRDRTEGRLEAVADLDRALMIVGRDIAQAPPGGIEAGPEGLSVATLRGVTLYQFDGGVLTRRIAGATDDAALVQVVADALEDAGWRMVDGAGAWSDVWPPDDGSTDLRGVEIMLQPAPGQTARRLIDVATDSDP